MQMNLKTCVEEFPKEIDFVMKKKVKQTVPSKK